MNVIAKRLTNLTLAIEKELHNCGRTPQSVTLVGVSKKQNLADIKNAIEQGLTNIGENYVQEAQGKFPFLPPVTKHFIGHIQTNKAKTIVELFDYIQTIDRPNAALAIAKAARTMNKQLPVLLQVNISPNDRFGCPPCEVLQLAETINAQSHLCLEGIMAIGPLSSDEQEILDAFLLAQEIFKQVGGKTLSLGMSHDWRLALRAGSTMLRIGSALFGERKG